MNNGGPAFPSAGTSGMTLRDWFAGQILQGDGCRLANGVCI